MSKPIFRIFVSSTYIDLIDYRKAAEKAINEQDQKYVGMEYMGAKPEEPVEACLNLVKQCDLFIGIYAWRYGYIPDGAKNSITEQEYNHAKKLGRPCLCYFVDNKFPWLPEFIEDGTAKEKVKQFKNNIAKEHVRAPFKEPVHLENNIIRDLSNWLADNRPDLRKNAQKKKPLRIPGSYIKWIIDNYKHLDAEKLYGSEMVPLSLPEIFIPLFTNTTIDKNMKMQNKEPVNDQKENKPIDIEELITTRDTLLIVGHPGSGKTTMMKHITYSLALHDSCCGTAASMHGRLPVLILLKELNDYFKELFMHDGVCHNAYEIICWYCETKIGTNIDCDTIKEFIEQNRAAILLDGLDELMPQHRDIVINHFMDMQIKYSYNKLVITSRPHGITGDAFRRFQENLVKINTLTMEQVEEFVRKWFGYFYRGECGPGGRTATAMMGEVQTHPVIEKLIDNPLMLTAIRILYHDQKELPAQRSELYKRFVDNMLYRRFGSDFENVQNYLKNLAHSMHTAKTKQTGEKEALKVLRKVYKQQDSEDSIEYETRMRKKFDEIESKCGLLKFDAGQYEFLHLTFQEFLCADYISDNNPDAIQAIEGYWDDDWYKEMVELYISYISIRSKATANTIVQNALDHPDQKRWLKASAALYDIQKNRRDADIVVPKARQRILSVFQTEENVRRVVLAEAGDLLGWLGDPRDLKAFEKIEGGVYKLDRLETLTLEHFEMGKYPVTNDWYEEFVKADGYKNKDYWSDVGWQWREKEKIEYPEYWYNRNWKCSNAPVVGVSFYEAEAFCKWLTEKDENGRKYKLPREQQWQAAAAGKGGRKFPWGNGEDFTRCNCYEGEDKIEKTSAVGIFEKGKTREGIYDMAGNVWEWCDTFYGSVSGSNRVLRGGSWYDYGLHCRSATRSSCIPDYHRNYNLNFRLVFVP